MEGLRRVSAAPYFPGLVGVGSRFRLRYPYQLASGFIRIQGRFDRIQLWNGLAAIEGMEWFDIWIQVKIDGWAAEAQTLKEWGPVLGNEFQSSSP